MSLEQLANELEIEHSFTVHKNLENYYLSYVSVKQSKKDTLKKRHTVRFLKILEFRILQLKITSVTR